MQPQARWPCPDTQIFISRAQPKTRGPNGGAKISHVIRGCGLKEVSYQLLLTTSCSVAQPAEPSFDALRKHTCKPKAALVFQREVATFGPHV